MLSSKNKAKGTWETVWLYRETSQTSYYPVIETVINNNPI